MISPMRPRSAAAYLSQLEKGAVYASLKIIGRLAEALDVKPAELLKLPGSKISIS
jgi:transcriptional regulator with XRE-family HTH domain